MRACPCRYLFFLVVIAFFALQPLLASAQDGPAQDEIARLLDTLENGDLLAQELAAEQLAQLAPVQAIPQLTRILEASDTPRLAASVLGAIGTPSALTALVNALDDETLTLRRNAAQIGLVDAGEKAIQPLSVALVSTKPALRRNAADLLGYIDPQRATTLLLRVARRDADPSVRIAAIWSLSQTGNPDLMPVFKSIAANDPDPDVRATAELAEGQLDGGG
jgi:HEAT repeat protein